MEGTDVARIAECLGLDTSKFHISVAAEQAEQEELYTLDSQINDEERFKDVEKLNVRCRGCQQRFDIAGVARIEVGANTTMLYPIELFIELTLVSLG